MKKLISIIVLVLVVIALAFIPTIAQDDDECPGISCPEEHINTTPCVSAVLPVLLAVIVKGWFK